MNSFNTLLLITACLSSSAYSMEQSLVIQQKTFETLTKNDHADIQRLYQDTFEKLGAITLVNNPMADTTSENNTNADSLLSIITQTERLKLHGISAQLIGKVVFQQKAPLKTKIFNNNPPYNSPHYISVFFERLSRYNQLLTQQLLKTPTIEQYILYKHDQKIVAAIRKAAYFNLTIEHDTIANNAALIGASQEFEQLINDIWKMRNMQPGTIETIATILYETTDANK